MQLSKEFLNQNMSELYSMDTLKVSSRLNSFSRALNWVCIEGEVDSKSFFSMKKGNCKTSLFQQNVGIKIPEASNTQISFTLKISKELELLFIIFLLLQIALIATLIAATKKAEEEKTKSERETSKLSRKMFHDIRSPLASLNTIAETTTFESKTEHEIFQTSIFRINEIANSLLSKTKSGTILLPSYVNLEPFLESVVEEKKREYRQIDFHINFVNKISVQVFLEPAEFKRILSNLINNSVEACRDNPKIELSITQEADKLVLIISDNGTGIPKKIIDHLGTKEITTKKEGNGIGLKDAFESMLEWSGSLDILETNKSGTKIKLTFLSKAEIELFILIDDDDLTRITWESKARKAGFHLRTFASPKDFNIAKSGISKNAIIYIDSELGDIKGEAFALDLHKEGFINISLATGHPAENFKEFDFLNSVISKAAPF